MITTDGYNDHTPDFTPHAIRVSILLILTYLFIWLAS
jgi:hypothetical protein